MTPHLPLRAVAALAAGALLVPLPPAVADHETRSATITARSSQDVVQPGEQVVLRGRFLRSGSPAAGSVVKVQTGHVGDWRTLDGARVRTGADGRFRVRVVLHRPGVRDLRVVGVVPGPRREAFARVTLMVRRGDRR